MTITISNRRIRRRKSCDRFIPERSHLRTSIFEVSDMLFSKPSSSDVEEYVLSKKPRCVDVFYSPGQVCLNPTKHFYNIKEYQKALWEAMMPETASTVLKCTSSIKKIPIQTDSKEFAVDSEYHWPVKPRKKPTFQAPMVVLDMPNLDTDVRFNCIDWNKKGWLATIFEGEISMWQAMKAGIVPTEDKPLEPEIKNARRCIKFNRDGSLGAASIKSRPGIAIWKCATGKVICKTGCKCTFEKCTVLSLEWTEKNCLISGCSKGRICIYNEDFKSVRQIYGAHAHNIIKLQLSCRSSYLASSGLDGWIRIWNMNNLCPESGYRTYVPTKAFCFHPWKESLIAFASVVHLHIFDVSTKTRHWSKHIHQRATVDALTFNPLSGELVVSYFNWGEDGAAFGTHYLTVLKNLTTVVDEIVYHQFRVPYLLWDATGTRLASASADEDLCIWNFFGKNEEFWKKHRKSEKKELTTDMLKTARMIGHTIR